MQLDRVARAGGWLFRQRTWLPLPVAIALLVMPGGPPSFVVQLFGVAAVAAGELIRLWAVRHIGVISRTRSDRLGPLVSSGPFGLVRNPLYIGNLLLWTGFAVSAGLLWLAPIVAIVFAAEYHAIVRWEEALLADRLGDAYRAYAARVGRWVPSGRGSAVDRSEVAGGTVPAKPFTWSETLFSERGTIIAIAVGYGLLWVKFRIS
jgi:protein-S-isoprenylcysteine O-methyltransferase Ste14